MGFGALGGVTVFGMLLTARRWPISAFAWFFLFVVVWAVALVSGVRIP